MTLKPTYRIFPEPSASDKKGGWSYSTDFIEQIKGRCEEWPLGMEDVEGVLLAIEDLAGKADIKEVDVNGE